MQTILQQYTVWFRMDGWGTNEQQVKAIDIQDAINQVVNPIREKFGEDKKIYIVKVQ